MSTFFNNKSHFDYEVAIALDADNENAKSVILTHQGATLFLCGGVVIENDISRERYAGADVIHILSEGVCTRKQLDDFFQNKGCSNLTGYSSLCSYYFEWQNSNGDAISEVFDCLELTVQSQLDLLVKEAGKDVFKQSSQVLADNNDKDIISLKKTKIIKKRISEKIEEIECLVKTYFESKGDISDDCQQVRLLNALMKVERVNNDVEVGDLNSKQIPETARFTIFTDLLGAISLFIDDVSTTNFSLNESDNKNTLVVDGLAIPKSALIKSERVSSSWLIPLKGKVHKLELLPF